MEIKLVTTIYKENKPKTLQDTAKFYEDKGVEMQVVNLYPQIEYQTFDGFGGAITEASGYTFSRMSEENQKRILDAYFGEEGNNYKFVRTHIDSCDFSVSQYEAMSDPSDREFKTFTLERDEKYILPLLRAAQETAGEPLNIMLSPWSPPAFMKTNGQRIRGGALKKEYREFWAEYVCQYIKEYMKKGFEVKMITIQNEPNANQSWDSCLYNAEDEKEFLRDFLYPALVRNNLESVEVCIWDHNKERVFERACTIIDEETDKMVQNVAFHWYTGDHFDAVKLVRDKFPDKKLIHSEGCVEYSRHKSRGPLKYAQIYAHDIIGNLNAGMNAFIDWNIILDEKGGPNHVENYCDAPIMCDTVNDKIEKQLTYTYIGHFSRFIKPGAKRIASTKYTNNLEVVAVKNPDDSITVVFLNSSKESIPVKIRINGQVTELTIPEEAIVTGIISK